MNFGEISRWDLYTGILAGVYVFCFLLIMIFVCVKITQDNKEKRKGGKIKKIFLRLIKWLAEKGWLKIEEKRWDEGGKIFKPNECIETTPGLTTICASGPKYSVRQKHVSFFRFVIPIEQPVKKEIDRFVY